MNRFGGGLEGPRRATRPVRRSCACPGGTIGGPPGLEFDAETLRQRAIAGGHPPRAEPCTRPRGTGKWDEEDVRRLDET
ncbi:hypothetical protein ADL04_28935 [Streptomyces sp. NRRL B-3648]|nr:hypothetical protein ADL04_28935 [Streptomyces sp. NRRL B-3648]